MGAELRISPEMASFERVVLGFIRQYLARWGRSPSYDEIVAGLKATGSVASKTSVYKAVKRMTARGEILRSPGAHRGIRLPDDIATAIRTLREVGYRVDEDISAPAGPLAALGAALLAETNEPLPVLLELEHIPDVEIGGVPGEGTQPR